MRKEQEDGDSRASGYAARAELASLLPVMGRSPSESEERGSTSHYRPVAFAACLLLVAALLLRSFNTVSPAAKAILVTAGHRALGGGVSGAIAGVAQVLAFMWLRTAMNYQYRHGGSMAVALRTLYAQGGLPRFYQGVGFALVQNPFSRFGDTAANTGVLSIFEATPASSSIPVSVRTAVASGIAALWRVSITPLDTCKTTLQVEGRGAYALLLRKAQRDGWLTMWEQPRPVPRRPLPTLPRARVSECGHAPRSLQAWIAYARLNPPAQAGAAARHLPHAPPPRCLRSSGPTLSSLLTRWNGAMGNAAANFVGSYPWFLTFNLLDGLLPAPDGLSLGPRLLRSAFMGSCATAVSDTASNSIRVVKTTKQTSATSVSYAGAVRLVVANDGWTGLLFRGLGTRLLANALQSALFSVIWKAIEAQLE